jgi:hypothetical protein
MDYKYTATFEAPLLSCEINPITLGASLISEASLKNLEPLIPKDIDYNDNVDLMGVAFNAAVINQFNKNGDGMDSATAVKYANNFIHKPTNIEHDKQKVVGHIVSAGYSDYKSSELIEENRAASMKEPFNIALGAVLYKTINSNFTDLVEKSLDPDSNQYQKVSASWEVGFNDYVLAVGGDLLSESRIISDPEEIEEMQGFLRSYGGNGKTDKGETINRLIKGDIYPLGIAYTLNPAADVKGLYSPPEETVKVFISDKRDKISQNSNLNVNNEKNIIDMELEKTLNELKDLLSEKKFSKEAVASMTDTFADAIRQRDEQYRKDLDAERLAKETKIKEYEDLKTSVAELEAKLGTASEQIGSTLVWIRLMRNSNLMTKIVNSSLLSLKIWETKPLMRHSLLNSISFGRPRIKRFKKSSTLRSKPVSMQRLLKNFRLLLLKKLKLEKLSTLLKQ